MRSTFAKALADVLVLEGGKVDHPKDPGGRTNKGVTQRVYNAYRARRLMVQKDVYLISDSEVAEIYRAQYADKVRFDDLPVGVDLVVFDGAVNSGPGQSIKWLQRALGNVKVDGSIGEATLSAVAAHPDHDRLIAGIIERRFAFLKALKTWPTFGKGWTRRVEHVKASGQALASGSVGPKVSYFIGGEARAFVEDARKVPGKGLADALSGGGIVTTTITQVTDAVAPLADKIPSVGTIVTVLTAIGVAATVAGLLYRRWASAKEAELVDALDLKPVVFTDDPGVAPANDNPPQADRSAA